MRLPDRWTTPTEKKENEMRVQEKDGRAARSGKRGRETEEIRDKRTRVAGGREGRGCGEKKWERGVREIHRNQRTGKSRRWQEDKGRRKK